MQPILSLIVFLVVLGIVAVAAYYIVVYFKLPRPAFMIVGVLLLLALIFFVFGAYGNAALVPIR